MREIRTSGSEGGGTEPNRPSLPLSKRFAQCSSASAVSDRCQEYFELRRQRRLEL